MDKTNTFQFQLKKQANNSNNKNPRVYGGFNCLGMSENAVKCR